MAHNAVLTNEATMQAFAALPQDPRSLDVPVVHLPLIHDEGDNTIVPSDRVTSTRDDAHQRGVEANGALRP